MNIIIFTKIIIIIKMIIIIITIKEIIMTLMNDLQERQLPECPAVPPEREGMVQVLKIIIITRIIIIIKMIIIIIIIKEGRVQVLSVLRDFIINVAIHNFPHHHHYGHGHYPGACRFTRHHHQHHKKPSFVISSPISTIIIVIIQQDHQHPNLSSSTS